MDPRLVVVTGPIAAGKSTVADLLAERLTGSGRTAVVVDVDEVAAAVAGRGAAASGLWSAAHRVHGHVVAAWLREPVDVVIAVGPIYDAEEQEALTNPLPAGTKPLWVVIDADVGTTFARALGDSTRGCSREHGFHHERHRRFRGLSSRIPAGYRFDSTTTGVDAIAAAIVAALVEIPLLLRRPPRFCRPV